VNSEEPSTHLRWRFSALLLLSAAIVLFAVGIIVRSPVPVLFAFPLLLAPLCAALFGPRTSPIVRVEGRTDGTGRSVQVTAILTPEPPLRPESLEFYFRVPPGVVEAQPPRTEYAGPHVRVTLFWSVPDPTVMTVPPPRVLWRDPLGLVERTATLEYTELFVERYPPELHRAGAVRLRRTLSLPGETRSRAIGASGEFFGIREAAPGDPPRRINWRATARAGRRLANEYALDRTGDLLILLDTRPTMLGPGVDGRLLAIERGAAFGLADAFLREKSRVGVATFGEFLHAVPLATGRTQRVLLRTLLLHTELAVYSGPAERCAVAFRRYYPPNITTVILSPLASEEQMNLVSHVRRRGFPVVVLSPSYLPMMARRAGLPVEDEELVGRFARLRRREEVSRMWQDTPVVDWEDFWSLGGFVDFMRRPAARERGS
jgi:uncharacterized protein (DUF58 family)